MVGPGLPGLLRPGGLDRLAVLLGNQNFTPESLKYFTFPSPLITSIKPLSS
jgi:hypothetical protein